VSAGARVTIESIAGGGDGVARLDGLTVFVPRSAPGDVAEIRLATRRAAQYARGEIVELVRPAPDRVGATCRHYDGDRCGGCQLQHLAYGAQLEAKQRIVADALGHIAKRRVMAPPIVPGPQWHYRARLTLSARRIGKRWIAGLHTLGNPDRLFDLEECPITNERLVAAWHEIRAAMSMWPMAPELRFGLRLVDHEVVVVVEGGTDWPHARRFAVACPVAQVIRWKPARGRPRVVSDRRVGTAPALSFEQVNPVVAERLRAHVLERGLVRAPRTAIDAYAGSGAHAIALAERGVAVTAIEVDVEASAFTARRLPAGSRAVTAQVEDALGAALPADLVIVNPPRTGLAAEVTSRLEGARPVAILYVSCNPATLARDLTRLPSYRITSLTTFDMFPQTAHVETVCELELTEGAA
jgi:23S rRNA (uracil1939-C5)-methyltransferase